MIEVQGLTKYYGNKPGVRDISFSIAKGETVGLLGPNGAGKTTIMKMLAGQMLPSDGSITIDGIDSLENPKEAARRVGFMPEIPPLYPEMEVFGYLKFIAEIRGVSAKDAAVNLNKIMEMTAISHVKDRLIKNLSKGYRQRVGLAQALVGFPSVLILDEPTVGLDHKQIAEVRKLIDELSYEHTIILSSHILSEIKMTCKRVIIVNNGRKVLEDTVKNLEEGGSSFIIRIKGQPEKAAKILASTPGVAAVMAVSDPLQEASGYYRFTVNAQISNELREGIFRRLAAADMPIIELRTIGNSLEEVFLDITA
jgi:ABC-2 type transport system ATP-binding protein